MEQKLENSDLSLGEKRVGTKFNVSDDTSVKTLVGVIKDKSAELINICENEKQRPSPISMEPDWRDGEQKRLFALAQTAYEEAAMWAVKAATIFN
jgi:hypothetical protein